jgi:16S rRNA (guanine1516-N2)-methyltransferase
VPAIRVEALAPEYRAAAAALADSLKLPLEGKAGFALQLGERGLQLVELADGAPGPIRVDFVSGQAAYRRHRGGGSRQMLAKAAGLRSGVRPFILDATAGLGRDAFVLAGLGCALTLVERHAIVAALLEDGWRRAHDHPKTAPVMACMRLIREDAIALMRAWRDIPPQVIYLDPMFPSRTETARAKKEMRLFRSLAGDDGDAPALLEAALALASHRVFVKRPRKAPPIAGLMPKYTLEGQSNRFDIYPKKSLAEK